MLEKEQWNKINGGVYLALKELQITSHHVTHKGISNSFLQYSNSCDTGISNFLHSHSLIIFRGEILTVKYLQLDFENMN